MASAKDDLYEVVFHYEHRQDAVVRVNASSDDEAKKLALAGGPAPDGCELQVLDPAVRQRREQQAQKAAAERAAANRKALGGK